MADELPWPENAVDPSVIPKTGPELVACMASKRWRMYSGLLYKILVKDEDDENDEGFLVPFRPNEHQTHYFLNRHTRSNILKARQLGFTTGIAIETVDHNLWTPHQRSLFIAQGDAEMEKLFRDKVLLAFDNLPPFAKALVRAVKRTERMIEFSNNSAMSVSLSGRSGTFQRIHISEFGKISARTPKRAKEIRAGAFPTLTPNGNLVIESTAEGRGGEFHKISEQARIRSHSPEPLHAKEFKFMFYAWWKGADNEVDPTGVIITDAQHKYFDEVEQSMNCLLTNRKRAWWVMTLVNDFSGDEATMWAEHPSTPDEAWQKSSAGRYYSKQLTEAKNAGRIGNFPPVKSVRTIGFWDIGHTDGTGIWLMQEVAGYWNVIGYIEGWEEAYDYYTAEMQATGHLLGEQFLPHDADNKRQGKNRVYTPQQLLEELMPNIEWQIVNAVADKTTEHALVRKHFHLLRFDEAPTAAGREHLDNYQKRWNNTVGEFEDVPLKNSATECADALGQWAKMIEGGYLRPQKNRRKKRNVGAKAV